MAKFKIVINNLGNLNDLLQEIYDESNAQIIEIQNEINKMANSTNLVDMCVSEKASYGKIINDYLKAKDLAISKKIEISKLLNEIIKHNGSLEATAADKTATKNLAFDFDKIRKMVEDNSKNNQKTENYEF